MKESMERTALLLGEGACEKLQKSLVILAGLGGVGGHCAEALARAGVGQLHIVDADVVTESNLNRQLVATKATVGQKKTAAMAERLAAVSDCLVTSSDTFLTPETVDGALPEGADFLIDAIDSVPGKLALIRFAHEHNIPMVSCMGAGNRLDPERFCIRDLFDTEGDPLARKMRHEVRKLGVTALPVVYSTEPAHAAPGQKVIGSLAPVTATAGLLAAAYAIRVLVGAEEG